MQYFSPESLLVQKRNTWIEKVDEWMSRIIVPLQLMKLLLIHLAAHQVLHHRIFFFLLLWATDTSVPGPPHSFDGIPLIIALPVWFRSGLRDPPTHIPYLDNPSLESLTPTLCLVFSKPAPWRLAGRFFISFSVEPAVRGCEGKDNGNGQQW